MFIQTAVFKSNSVTLNGLLCEKTVAVALAQPGPTDRLAGRQNSTKFRGLKITF